MRASASIAQPSLPMGPLTTNLKKNDEDYNVDEDVENDEDEDN